jgi:SAM-dependent methyltransferase
MIIDKLLYPIVLRRDVNETLKQSFLKHLRKDMDVYDIGCGEKPFASFLEGKIAKHIGVDIADGFYNRSSIDLIGSAYDVPAPDNSADAVILSQVIEHLETPRVAFKEAQRILKPGGLLFLSFPFLYPVHAEPRDFFRYTDYGCEHILAENGFESLEKSRIGGFWYCAGFFFKVYLQNLDRGLLKKLYIVKILTAVIQWICLFFNKIEEISLKAAGKKPSDFRDTWTINYIMVARKS